MIPETPADKDYFAPQHGYNDIEVKTQEYGDEPTPLPAHKGKVNEFVSEKTDRDHQKKYAKKAGKKLFHILLRQFCH